MFGHDNHTTRDDEVIQDDTGGIPKDAIHHPQDDPGYVATPVTPTVPDSAAAPSEPKASAPTGVTDDLLDIKQEALQELTPLVGQLDQTPEEQFRTTMMMIQASDNHSLVKVAYDAAKKISNEKERAQALLDIVNEINYFTQQSSQPAA